MWGRRPWHGVVGATLATLLGACFNLKAPEQFNCSEEHPECPAGLECRADKCVAPGADSGRVDSGRRDVEPPPRDRSVVDAPPAADSGGTCGDGEQNGTEECDGQDLGGATCESRGYFAGTLTCTRGCAFDESLCTRCGDGKLDAAEDCDGAAGGKSCQDLGFDGGTISCTAECTWNTDQCTRTSCGNGTLDTTEDCDGSDLGGATCVTKGFEGGDLACKSNCAFDDSGCYKCGDGLINGPAGNEACDGAELGGQTCVSVGFEGGTLKCAANCKSFDTAACYKCGDGLINGPPGGEVCDGTNVGTQTCKTQGFDGGTLKCSSNCKSLDISGCYECGDGKIDPGELCDKTALNGQTCVTQGFEGGTLACSTSCTFDTAACYKCGDGKLNGAEECDASDFGGKTCATWTFGGGTLSCSTNCKLSKAACTTTGYVSVVAGTFMMGSPDSEPCRATYTNDAEKQHQVQLTHPFEIAISETTQGEFSSRMGYNPSYYTACGSTCPVENLSWSEMVAYCNALSTLRELAPCYTCSGSGGSVACTDAWGANIYSCPGYRLPTDAEWEYAYRAGQTTAYHNGYNGDATLCTGHMTQVDPIGWYYYTGETGEPRPVMKKQPNAWGLYDMAGNVGEKIHGYYNDAYTNAPAIDPVNVTGTYRTTRGGDAGGAASTLRAASHTGNPLDSKWRRTGFRCVRSR